MTLALSYFLLDLRAQPRTSFFSFICQHVKMSVMKIITEREGREHSKPINCKPQVLDIFQKQPSKIQYPFFSISNDNHCDISRRKVLKIWKTQFLFSLWFIQQWGSTLMFLTVLCVLTCNNFWDMWCHAPWGDNLEIKSILIYLVYIFVLYGVLEV